MDYIRGLGGMYRKALRRGLIWRLFGYIAAVYQRDWYSHFTVECFCVPELLALRYAENIKL